MARNNKSNKFNQPRQQQNLTPPIASSTNAATATTLKQASSEVEKLQERINELESNLELEKEAGKEREANITKREQELAEKEAQAVNGFKELEAVSRQEWLAEKEQEIISQRELIIGDAQTEAAKIRLNAQREVDEIIKQAHKLNNEAQKEADNIIEQAQALANQHRQKAREQTLEEIKVREEKLEILRKILDNKENALNQADENLSRQKKQFDRQESILKEENDWLAAQKKKVQQQEQELIQRESSCSEAAINKLQVEKTNIEQQLQVIQEENYRLRVEVQKNDNLLQAVSGSPEKLLQDNRLLEDKLREYENLFEEYPTKLELTELRRRAEAGVDFEAKYQDLQARIDDLERLRRQQKNESLETEHLRKERNTLKLLNQYLNEQKEDLERMLGNLKDKKLQAFANFANMDDVTESDQENIPRIPVNKLNTLARQTRGWMASLPTREDLETGLSESSLFAHYYDEHTIQAFIASMAASRLIIIQGISGTGKTSLPEYFAYAMGGKFARVEVQSSWRDKLDLVGSYNSFFRVFNDSPFSRAIYEAGTKPYRNYPYFIVLDEMNLSRVEYYFADLLSIMEGRPEDREIELLNHDPSSGLLPQGLKNKKGAVKLPIPDNVWFIGTANTDESTYEITRKVYDRAQVLQIDKFFAPENLGITEAANLQMPDFREAVQEAIANFSNTDQQAVQESLEQIGLELEEYFQVSYGPRLKDQLFIFLPTYVAAGGTLGKGLDHFIARKLLSQVMNRTDPNVRSGLQEVRDTIEQSFADQPQLKNAAISLNLLDREINKFKR